MKIITSKNNSRSVDQSPVTQLYVGFIRGLKKTKSRLLFALCVFVGVLSFTNAQDAKAESCVLSIIYFCQDVAYGSASYQNLDIYRPQAAGLYPTIVYVHGGGWTGGGKSLSGYFDFTNVLRELPKGYAVVSIDYRLASVNIPETKAPGALLDVKQAIRWVKAYGAGYGLDATRVVVWGHSAGGHLAALAGATTGDAGTEPSAYGGVSSSVRGVFSFAGVYDFTLALPQGTANGASAYLQCLSPGANAWLSACSSSWLSKWSPAGVITANDPGVVIVHNEDDPLVPFNQAQRYQWWLSALNRPVGTCYQSTGGHGSFAACNSAIDYVLALTIAPGPR
jgi:acetyl esterase/lipase